VRRIFEQRARLVVYVESGDADKMEKRARSEGKTLVEWMRETLLGELATVEELSRPKPVRVARRRTMPNGDSGAAGLSDVAASAGKQGDATGSPCKRSVCKHGIARGWHCWQCGGMAIIEKEVSHA